MFELSLLCSQNRVETLSDALGAQGAMSVSVEDADAQSDAEQALFGEPGMAPPKDGWPRSRVSALYATKELAQDGVTRLQTEAFFADCQILEVQEVPEQDWVRLTQSQFTPVEITPEFWIVPSWHQPPTQARITIRLDPGLAFGTGTHATTRMCLRWIARHSQAGFAAAGSGLARVLDYGCGSGILAIAAAKHGAQGVDAIDIDAAAVESTRLNAQANQVRLTAGSPAVVAGLYQTVLANILATPLKVLAPLLWSHVAPGGSLVLAGILERQADELKAAYATCCQLQISDREDGWILMSARR